MDIQEAWNYIAKSAWKKSSRKTGLIFLFGLHTTTFFLCNIKCETTSSRTINPVKLDIYIYITLSYTHNCSCPDLLHHNLLISKTRHEKNKVIIRLGPSRPWRGLRKLITKEYSRPNVGSSGTSVYKNGMMIVINVVHGPIRKLKQVFNVDVTI